MQEKVLNSPGLLSVETLQDVNDHKKFITLSHWDSMEAYDQWLDSDDHKDLSVALNQVQDSDGKRTRILEKTEDDIFLL